jgi:hypothetical protein
MGLCEEPLRCSADGHGLLHGHAVRFIHSALNERAKVTSQNSNETKDRSVCKKVTLMKSGAESALQSRGGGGGTHNG